MTKLILVIISFSPDGVSWDWITHTLYWMDSIGRRIEALHPQNLSRKRFFVTREGSMLRAIALDPISR